MTKTMSGRPHLGSPPPSFVAAAVLAAPLAVGLGLLLFPAPAHAHHALELFRWRPTPLHGLISGFLHPVLGPDHLLFLLALSMVGLRHRLDWMLSLLAVGLLGSCMGLALPGLPGAEVMTALTLTVVALVLLDRLPPAMLLPAFALHGYVLSASVLGWSPMPVAAYVMGLAVSQGLLLTASLLFLSRAVAGLSARARRRFSLALAAVGGGLALAPLLA
jgi:urease accessory protein